MRALDAGRIEWVDRFDRHEAQLSERGPAWLAPLRRGAIDRFARLGFPTRKSEAWKYTNTAPIAQAGFDPTAPARGGVTRDDVHRRFGDAAEGLVFVDGRFAPELSSSEALSKGVDARSLASVLDESPEQVRAQLEGAATVTRPFDALNLAFCRDGAWIRVAPGADATCVQLLFLATGGRAAAQPRNFIRVERGARATVALHYASLGDEPYLTNAVTAVALDANAELEVVTVQAEGAGAYHLTSLDVTQARDSRFRSHVVSLGAALARSEVNALLTEPGVDCALNGLFLADGRQHMDNQTLIDHASPHGTSRELYKGILDGHSRGVFNGLVLVRPGAQKTNAQQSNPNLLTSDHARVNTKPTLEIHADDVKCSHGSTIGRLDEDALFYLRSRGIGERPAREMLTGAFASEIAHAIRFLPLRDQVEHMVAEKLARSGIVGEAA